MGAILLSLKFIPIYGFLKGIWYSIFHSITAFCNSGFDIIDSSLHRISQYCGTIYVDPFFKCTEDKFSGNLSIEDIEGLTDLILDMEEVNNEIKEENYCGN